MKRTFILLASIVALGPLAIDVYLPAIPKIARTFDLDVARTELSVSTFLLFFALGHLVGGPIADRKGRKGIILWGIAGFVVASIGIVFSFTFTQFILFRAVQAFCSGCAIVSAFSVTRDIFHGSELAKALSVITSIMLVVPMVAPLFGAVSLLWFEWRWIFVIIAVYGLMALAWAKISLRETLEPQYTPYSVWGAYVQVLGDKKSFLLLALSGSSMGVLFTFLTSSSSIYQQHFGVSAQGYSLFFMLNALSVFVVTNLNIVLLRYVSMKRLMLFGIVLQWACSAVLLALAYMGDNSVWLFALFASVAVGCIGIVLPNAASMLMLLHPRDAGTCNALGGLIRFTMGGVLGGIPTLFVHQGYSVTAFTMVVLAVLGVVSWWLMHRGEQQLQPLAHTELFCTDAAAKRGGQE